MSLNDLVHDGQAQSRAVGEARLEGFEEFFHLGLIETDTGIG